MSEPNDTTNAGIDPYHERGFHDSHGVGLSRDSREWVEAQDDSLDHMVQAERLRRENPDVWFLLAEACRDDYRRRTVGALVQHDGIATYDQLADHPFVTATKRTVKNHVFDLRDEGVVEIEDGRPATVKFVSDDILTMASDTLSLFW